MAEKKEATAAPAEGKAEAKGGGGGALLGIGAALMVAMLAGGFAMAYFVLPGKLVARLKAEIEIPAGAPGEKAAAKDAPGDRPAAAKPDGPGGEKSAAAAPAKVESFELREVIVNVSGSRAGRFVKVSLAFDGTPEVLAELARQRARVIDLVSGTLASKSEEQLRGPTARGQLRAEIIAAVNPLLEHGQVRNVFFLEYLLQP